MIKYFIFDCIFLFVPLVVNSQMQRQILTNDFLISTENNPSTIIQDNTQIFPDGNRGFVAVWDDYRDGEKSYYGQRFNAQGKAIGNNKKYFGVSDISFLEDNSSLVLNQYYSSFYDWQNLYDVEGRFFDSSGNVISTNYMAYASIPWCGTGYLGVDYEVTNAKESYIFAFRNDGFVDLKRYDGGGSILFERTDLFDYQNRAAKISIGAQPNGKYMLAWFGGEDTTYWSSYGIFFGSNDSIIARDVPLGFPIDSMVKGFAFSYPRLSTIMTIDSAYIIFGSISDSGKLYFRKFSSEGVALTPVQSLSLPSFPDGSMGIENFTVSNYYDNKLSIIITRKGYYGYWGQYKTFLYNFDSYGNSLGITESDTPLDYLGKYFYKSSADTSFIGRTSNNDVYLKTLNQLTVIDSLLINDDSIGSNDVSPNVISAVSDSFLVLWQDEIGVSAKKVSSAGISSAEKNRFQGNNTDFFNNGFCVNLWIRSDSVTRLGYSIYDNNWNIINFGIIATTSRRNYFNADIKSLGDSAFVVVYKPSDGNLAIRLHNLNGDLLKEKIISTTAPNYAVNIFDNDSTSFWIQSYDYLQLYSNSLDSLNEALKVTTNYPLGNHNFISIFSEYDNYFSTIYYGTIINVEGDTVKQPFELNRNVGEFTSGKLTNNHFLTLYKRGNNIYGRVFSNDGIGQLDSFLINASENFTRKNPAFAVDSGKILFTWAEAHTQGSGYDVFGRIVDISSIVSVEDQNDNKIPKYFSLSQNYPNPFNPRTTISYQLPIQSYVKLKVFDIIGREVATLVNGVEELGYKSVRFDASSLSSGVYYYRIQAGNYIETKKLLLLR